MVLELAKQKKWQRCPNCKFYEERTHGCPYMKCSKSGIEVYTADFPFTVGVATLTLKQSGRVLSPTRDKEVSRPRRLKRLIEMDKVKTCALKSNNVFESMYCKICSGHKPQKESMCTKNCSHSFCSDCIDKYIDFQTQKSISSIKCPEPSCEAMLDPDQFAHSVLPKCVFEAWCNVLCEGMMTGSQRFYCPFKDCSGLLVAEGGAAVVRESECPYCHRLFCTQCKVAWHSGKEEAMVLELAKQKNGRGVLIASSSWRGLRAAHT
ncbi:hypothetical protein Sjap_012007 [Stephania japonica]|uniref:RBR-type E3 ubiquitin transferase n=1 Tax=Stephania japonica TaxID=461633 RepID=A0AAP0JEH0_9MAGN